MTYLNDYCYYHLFQRKNNGKSVEIIARIVSKIATITSREKPNYWF